MLMPSVLQNAPFDCAKRGVLEARTGRSVIVNGASDYQIVINIKKQSGIVYCLTALCSLHKFSFGLKGIEYRMPHVRVNLFYILEHSAYVVAA